MAAIRASICAIPLPNPSSSSYQILLLRLPNPTTPVIKFYYSSYQNPPGLVVFPFLNRPFRFCYRRFGRGVLPTFSLFFYEGFLYQILYVLAETQWFGRQSKRVWRLLKFVVKQLNLAKLNYCQPKTSSFLKFPVRFPLNNFFGGVEARKLKKYIWPMFSPFQAILTSLDFL